jgi:hypothetical protein
MDSSRLDNINAIAEFLEHSKKLVVEIESIEDKYAFIFGVLKQFKYRKLTKKEKKVILKYMKKITGIVSRILCKPLLSFSIKTIP